MNTPDKFDQLYRQAEEFLDSQTNRTVQIPGIDALALIYESEDRQIGLQLQNEELRFAIKELQKSREGYEDLFQHAPMGRVELTRDRFIAQSNIVAGTLLRIAANGLSDLPFIEVIHPADQPKFTALLERTAKNADEHETCELRFSTTGNERFIQIEMVASDRILRL